MQDAVFDEEAIWSWGDQEPTSDFTIDYMTVDHPDTVVVQHEMTEANLVQGTPPPSPIVGAASPAPASSPSSALDIDHGEAPFRYRSIEDIMVAMALEEPAQGGGKVRTCCWLTLMSRCPFKMPRHSAASARRCLMR
jgi:hypothetical protein